jgi:large subunit ribosomal protein L10
MELYGMISSNKLKLLAKPNQVSPEDIRIESGETSIAPGQGVTDMKAAGIDVKIEKGKVVISKSKVLVAKGAKISTQVSKALKMLDILPFETMTDLRVIIQGNLVFTGDVFKINTQFVNDEMTRSFRSAYALSLEIGYVSPYNIEAFITRGFRGALAVGVEAKIPEGEAGQKLLGLAAKGAKSLDDMVKKE